MLQIEISEKIYKSERKVINKLNIKKNSTVIDIGSAWRFIRF